MYPERERKKEKKKDDRSRCKYFYRAAKLAVIHVNDLRYARPYLLTRRAKTSFTFSYFFNYAVLLSFSRARAFNCYAISASTIGRICPVGERDVLMNIGVLSVRVPVPRGERNSNGRGADLAARNLRSHLPNSGTTRRGLDCFSQKHK